MEKYLYKLKQNILFLNFVNTEIYNVFIVKVTIVVPPLNYSTVKEMAVPHLWIVVKLH